MSDACKLQRLLKNDRSCTVRLRPEPGKTRGKLITYRPYWPRTVTFVHPYNGHGAKPGPIPFIRLQDEDYRLLWTVQSILSSVTAVWETCAESVCSLDDWQGWMLTYLTMSNVHGTYKRYRAQNPFKFQKCSIKMVQEKLVRYLHGSEYAVGIDEEMENIDDEDSASTDSGNNDGQLLEEQDYLEEEAEDDDGEEVLSFGADADSDEDSDIDNATDFCDGYFHPQEMEQIFSKMKKKISVIQFDEDNIDSFQLCEMTEEQEAMILYRAYDYFDPDLIEREDRLLPCSYVDTKNNVWDIAYIQVDTELPEYSPDRRDMWTSSVFCRHGGQFDQWWMMKHKDKRRTAIPAARNGLPRAPQLGQWSVAVYRKRLAQKLTAMRDDFLCTIGGQSKVLL